MTLIPAPRQLYSSDSAFRRTLSGKVAGPAAKLKTRSEVGGATAAVVAEYEHLIEIGLMVARVIGSAWRLVVGEGLRVMLGLGFLRRKVLGVLADIAMVGRFEN